jgi:hypothetical protein
LGIRKRCIYDVVECIDEYDFVVKYNLVLLIDLGFNTENQSSSGEEINKKEVLQIFSNKIEQYVKSLLEKQKLKIE